MFIFCCRLGACVNLEVKHPAQCCSAVQSAQCRYAELCVWGPCHRPHSWQRGIISSESLSLLVSKMQDCPHEINVYLVVYARFCLHALICICCYSAAESSAACKNNGMKADTGTGDRTAGKGLGWNEVQHSWCCRAAGMAVLTSSMPTLSCCRAE